MLGDIPILGCFFKNRRENDDRTEVLIFLTPQITNKALAALRDGGRQAVKLVDAAPLFLIGFMAAGKTTVGPHARRAARAALRRSRRAIEADARQDRSPAIFARERAGVPAHEAAALAQRRRRARRRRRRGGGRPASATTCAGCAPPGWWSRSLASLDDVLRARPRDALGAARCCSAAARARRAPVRRAPAVYRRADVVVETGGRQPAEVADEVARRAGAAPGRRARCALGERSYPIHVGPLADARRLAGELLPGARRGRHRRERRARRPRRRGARAALGDRAFEVIDPARARPRSRWRASSASPTPASPAGSTAARRRRARRRRRRRSRRLRRGVAVPRHRRRAGADHARRDDRQRDRRQDRRRPAGRQEPGRRVLAAALRRSPTRRRSRRCRRASAAPASASCGSTRSRSATVELVRARWRARAGRRADAAPSSCARCARASRPRIVAATSASETGRARAAQPRPHRRPRDRVASGDRLAPRRGGRRSACVAAARVGARLGLAAPSARGAGRRGAARAAASPSRSRALARATTSSRTSPSTRSGAASRIRFIALEDVGRWRAGRPRAGESFRAAALDTISDGGTA